MGKGRVVLKWTFIFSILTIWSYFIITGSVIGSFSKSFNIPIYIQTSAGIEKANSLEIVDVLFNNDFSIQKKTEIISMEKCSLRADNGNLNIGETNLKNNNQLNFYISLKNSKMGTGSLIGGNSNNRLGVDFKINKIIQTDSEKLIIEGTGKGNLNKKKLSFDKIIISLDKTNNKVEIKGLGDDSFEAEDMEVDFMDGCRDEEKGFYLVMNNGELEKRRSIGEVRSILDMHPELIDMYENLRGLYNDYWWLAIPDVIVS